MTSITDVVFHPPFVAVSREGELAFPLHEPWYRSLPVSCFVELEVWVDDVRVPAERVALELNGQTRTVAQCAEASDEFWFVQDPLTVHLAGVTAFAQVKIRAHLVMRIPYIMVGPASALPHHAFQEETFEVAAA